MIKYDHAQEIKVRGHKKVMNKRIRGIAMEKLQVKFVTRNKFCVNERATDR